MRISQLEMFTFTTTLFFLAMVYGSISLVFRMKKKTLQYLEY